MGHVASQIAQKQHSRTTHRSEETTWETQVPVER